MRSRRTIKYERDEVTGQEIHLFENLSDEPRGVILAVDGFSFDAVVSLTPSGRQQTRLLLRIPTRWARVLGLIAPVKGDEQP